MTENEALKKLADYFEDRTREPPPPAGSLTLDHMHAARVQAYRHAADMARLYLNLKNFG